MSRRTVAVSIVLAAILAVGGVAVVRTGIAADLVTAGSPDTSPPTATPAVATTMPPPTSPNSPTNAAPTAPAPTSPSSPSTTAAPTTAAPTTADSTERSSTERSSTERSSTERSSTRSSWTTTRSIDTTPVDTSTPTASSTDATLGGTPPTTPDPVHDPAVVDPVTCPEVGRSAVVDRDRQLGWLCENGAPVHLFPVTTQRVQPDPGDYEVDAKDLQASSTISGEYTTMTHFVVFTRGKFAGARIGFHSVPKARDGSWVQPLETVGDLDWIDASAGCLRVLPDDAVLIWDWLELGGTVRVVT